MSDIYDKNPQNDRPDNGVDICKLCRDIKTRNNGTVSVISNNHNITIYIPNDSWREYTTITLNQAEATELADIILTFVALASPSKLVTNT